MVALRVATMFCMIFVLLPSVVNSQILVAPFELKGDNTPEYGDTRIGGDNAEVNLGSFPFGENNIDKFYISVHGVIRTSSTNGDLRVDTDWSQHLTEGNSYSVYVFLQHVSRKKNCNSGDISCGVFWRKGNDNATQTAIKSVINSTQLQLQNADQRPGFQPDPEQTLVVTWYKVPKYDQEELRNTFQGIITTDGKKSFAIFSYQSLEYPPKEYTPTNPGSYKTGVLFDKKKTVVRSCQPALAHSRSNVFNKKEQLLCKTNAYRQGTFVYGMAGDTALDCPNGISARPTCSNCEDEDNTQTPCRRGGQPVCGNDEITYGGLCQLRKAACEAFDGTKMIAYSGECLRDPCETENGGCEDKCRANGQQIRCQCSDGRRLKADGKSCDWTGYFYMGSRNMMLIGNGVQSYMIHKEIIGDVIAVAHDYDKNTLFFSIASDDMSYQIKSYNPTTKYETILDSSVLTGRVTHMMFDARTSTLYYATDDGNIKSVSDVYGTKSVNDLFTFGDVSGMNGEPCEGLMFLVDSTRGSIYTINDADPMLKPIITGLTNPIGLAVDYENHKIYWYSDEGFAKSNYDGSCREQITTGGTRPFSMIYIADHLIWTGGISGSLVAMNLKTVTEQVIAQLDTPLYGMGLIGPDDPNNLKPNVSNGKPNQGSNVNTRSCEIKRTCSDNCTLDNGGCEDICSPSGPNSEVRCQCSDRKYLKDDGKSCDWRNYFYVGSENSLHVSNGGNAHDIDVIGSVTSIAFDYSSNTLFFATDHNGEYSINAFHPKTITKTRTILDKTLSQKVTEMIYSSHDVTIYFATADGQVSKLPNVFGKMATVESIHKFSSVSGMGGTGGCRGGTMFVIDSNDGIIYSTSAIGFQPIITGLTNPRGLAIDYVRQLLYWSSDAGIEEAKYDGSCRRSVVTSMGGRRPFAMVFADTLYWTDEHVHNGRYSVMRTDISTGHHIEVSHSPKNLYGITYIYPEDSWQLVERREQVMSTIKGHQVPVPVLGKQFKIKFNFMAVSSRHAMSIGDIGNTSYTEPGLTVFFDIDGNVESTTIPVTVNKRYSIGITQEKEGGHYRFLVKSNNNVVHTVINNGAKVREGENIWMFDMEGPTVYEGFEVHKKVPTESCSALTTECPVYCSESPCEDECVANITMPGYDRCKCSDGKGLKADMRSCDWAEYIYMGMNRWIMVFKGSAFHLIEADGKVVSMDHDYQRNTLFFSVEQPLHDGGYKYSINTYHPKKTYRMIADDLSGRAENLNYDPFTKTLLFSIDHTLHIVNNVYGSDENIPTVETLQTFNGTITGLQGEPCDRKLFVAVGGEGSIYEIASNMSTSTNIISGITDLIGLTIDYHKHKLIWYSDSGLEESSYDGSCRRIITHFGSNDPLGMHLAGRTLMWSNSANASVGATNIDTGSTTYYPTNSENKVLSMRMIFDRSRYPDVCPIKMQCNIGDCNMRNGGCEETCVINAGRAQCICSSGKLQQDQKRCDETGSILIGTENGFILNYNQLYNGPRVTAVDYRYMDGNLSIFYASEEVDDSTGIASRFIYKHPFRQSNQRVNISEDSSGDVVSLAYDHIGDMVFTTHGDTGIYCTKGIYGGNESTKTIAHTNDRSIVVVSDTCKRRIFFIDTADLYVLQLEQENATAETILTGLKSPEGLAIDIDTQKLYFTDDSRIFEVNYDGSCKRMISEINTDLTPIRMAVSGIEDTIYWTARAYGQKAMIFYVMKTSLSTGKTVTHYKGQETLYDIRIIFDRKDSSARCREDNFQCTACLSNNGGCDDICIPDHVTGDVSCRCTSGNLSPDGKSCDFSDFSIYGSNNAVVLVSVKNTIVQQVTGMVHGVEYDFQRNIIFYSIGSNISRFDIKGRHKDVYYPATEGNGKNGGGGGKGKNGGGGDKGKNGGRHGNIERLAYDETNQDMYFTTEHNLRVIRNISTSGLTTSMELSSFDRTSGLAFEPCQRKVFVTCNASRALYKWQEGTPLVTIITDLNNPRALTIDLFERKLYFFEHDMITQINYDGSCKTAISKGIKDAEPYGMVAVGYYNFIFWTDTKISENGNYHIWNTTFDGNTKTIYKDPYSRTDVKAIYDRNLAVCHAWPATCIIGACRYSNGGCQDKCIVEDGKHRCECTHGILKPCGKMCDYTNFVIYSVGRSILMTDLKTEIKETAIGETRGVEFDFKRNIVYYAIASQWPRRSELRSFDTKSQHKLIFTSDQEIQFLAFDSDKQVMYFTTYNALTMINLYGGHSAPRVLGYFKLTTGLAFEPCERKVFVSCGGTCGLHVWQEGKEMMAFPVHFHDATALAIDLVKQKLYVFDKDVGIVQVNYDGSCKKIVAPAPHGSHAYVMEYVATGNYLLWTDLTKNQVMRTILGDWSPAQVVSNTSSYGFKRIFDRKFTGSCPARMSCDSEGGCADNRGGCEQVCSVEKDASGSAACHCKYGGKLRKDGKTCDYTNLVYFASGRYLMFRYGDNLEKASIIHTADYIISAIAHNKNGIFVASIMKGGYSEIYYKQLNEDVTKVVTQMQGTVVSLAYDQHQDALYYAKSDGPIHKIVTPLSHNPRDEFLIRTGDPREIVLSYCNRDMIFIDMYNKFGKVMKIREGEPSPAVINYGFEEIRGLTLDRERNMLYWYCALTKTIQESRANFTCQRTVARAENVKAMVFRDMNIYYDDGSGNINVVELKNGMQRSLPRIGYPVTGGMKLFDDVTKALGSDWFKGSDGYYYKLYVTSADWFTAQATCRSEGAHLAVVNSAETFEFINNMVTNKYTNWIWIGGRDENSNNDWKWVSGEPVKETYWQSGEPNNYGGVQEDCMVIYPMSGAHLHDAPCSWADPNFLCQKEVVMPTGGPTMPSTPRSIPTRSIPTGSMPQSTGATAPTPTAAPNGKDWVQGTDGHYYKFYEKKTDWSAAQAMCRSEGANLAVVDSPATFEYIKNMIATYKVTNHIWIGGRDESSTNFFKWVSGTPVETTYWYVGEPNNYNNDQEDCMAISPAQESRFLDVNCLWEDPNVLCQKRGSVQPAPMTTAAPNQKDWGQGSDGYYYKFYNRSVDWATAQAICRSEGANLAIVDSVSTFEFLKNMIMISKNTDYIWIGGRDENSDNTFKWIGGTPVEEKYWYTGEPNNADNQEDCMMMYPAPEARFFDVHCLWSDPKFLCQKRGDVTPATRAPPPRKQDAYKQGYDGNYYKYFSERKTWEDAKAHCEADNAMLAIDHSDRVHMYMQQSFPQNFWVGANDKEMEGRWMWVDGKYVEKSYWHNGKDYSKAEDNDCVYMRDGKWDHNECDEKKPFLCQRKGTFDECGSGMECPRRILYPFGRKFGDDALPRGDEEFAHLHFEAGIPFFSRMASDVYIGTNGVITADGPETRWNITADFGDDHTGGYAAIYMMDLTTENGGDIFYRVTNDKTVLGRIAFEVSLYHGIPKGYKPSYALIVTWNEVRVKRDPSKKVTFQLVYHTDGNIAVSNTIYAKLEASGGVLGYSEGRCNHYYNPDAWMGMSSGVTHSSNIGINGIYVGQVSKPECGIPKVSHPIEVRYKTSDAAMEAAQSFYFDGENKVTNVFTQTYSWDFTSVSFVTSVVYKLDQIYVKYVYFNNAPFVYKWGVSTLIVRDNVDNILTGIRNGKVQLRMVWNDRKCRYHEFKESLDKSPCMLLNAMIPYSRLNPLNALTNVWLHNVSMEGFNVCYKDMVDFWSPTSISVDYLAVTHESPAIAEFGAEEFTNLGNENNVVSCESVHFKYLYPKIPAVFVTPEVESTTAQEEVIAWVKESKRTYTVICVRHSRNETDMSVPNIKVHYTVHTMMDKCSKFRCDDHLECQLDEQGNPECGCKKNCSDYEQKTFCGSNLHTYHSKCELEKQICENKTTDDVTMVYPGACKQYPYQTGKTTLENITGVHVAFCKRIELNAANFHHASAIQVLLTVAWSRGKAGNIIHDAAASWSEDVTVNGFTACVMVAGRHLFDVIDPPIVHWVAYQSGVTTASEDLEAGTIKMKTWYTGSRCQSIKLKKYTSKTKVLVSVEHSKPRAYKNAMTAWVEKIDGTESHYMCKICARELQNFDGVHRDIMIHYMAIHNTVDKYIVEPNEIIFERQHFNKDDSIPPICKTVKFNYNFPSLSDPTVIVTAVNTSSLNSNSVFSPRDIAVWIEGNNDTHLTACFKSLRAGLFREEVILQYVIWPKLCATGWRWHDGYCYCGVDRQTNKTDASNDCVSQGSELPAIELGTSKAHYFSTTWATQFSSQWVSEGCMTYNSNNTISDTSCSHLFPYVCEKDPALLEHGCNCMNKGVCEKTEGGRVECKCKDNYIGRWCEKSVHKSCIDYKRVNGTVSSHLSTDVWYRFPGRQMVEYCPRHVGCASIDHRHPTIAEGEVTRNLIYGNYYAISVDRRCEKGYGSVKIRNCGEYYVYCLQTLHRREELCFERHTAQKR